MRNLYLQEDVKKGVAALTHLRTIAGEKSDPDEMRGLWEVMTDEARKNTLAVSAFYHQIETGNNQRN